MKLLLNGPESFTLDGNFILGEAPELARLFRLRRIQLGRHRQRRRRGQARRRMDRRRRRAARPLGRRHPPLRAVPRESPASRRPHRGDRWACTTRCAGRARSSRPSGRCAARRSTTGSRAKGAVFGTQAELGARELFPAAGRGAAAVHARHPGLAAVRARGAARVPRGCRRVRSDVVRASSCSRAATRWRCCSGCARTRSTCRRQHGLHGDAQCARRIRKRPHDHAARAGRVLHHHRLRADDARLRVDRARTSATTSTRRWSTSPARYSVISVMGPKAEALLGTPVGRTICPRPACRSATTRMIDVGHARVRAARMSYVGGPGYELYVTDRPVRHALRRAVERGRRIRPAGRRLLHDRRVAHRSGPPRMGRGALARRDAVGGGARLRGQARQAGAFIGRDALRAQQAAGAHASGSSLFTSTTRRCSRGAASRS